MSKKQRLRAFLVFGVILILLLCGIFLVGKPNGAEEPIGEVMKNEVLHETNRVRLGPLSVNPGLISAFTLTGIFLVFCVIVRLFVIPRFKKIPGRFQLFLEEAVGMFDRLSQDSSPHRHNFLGAYVFAAGAYIFIGTLFELFGFQVVTESGRSAAMPAPLSDINGAIAMGFLSYGVILFGGLLANGFSGMLHALKDFSLPISMSFRLFGALLSGALVTELVYYYTSLSYVLPVVVGVLFTLLHALIQAYVLTMLTALFYGEVTEKKEPKPKKRRVKKQPASK